MAEKKAAEGKARETKGAAEKAKSTVAAKPHAAKAAAQEDPEARIESAIGRTERYIMENGKRLTTILVVALLAVGAFMAYKHMYLPGRSQKAGAMMFVAEQQYQAEVWDAALNGDGNNAGFLDVIAAYGGTPEGNLARHYAGICFLNLDDQASALKYLGEYRATSGIPNSIVNAQNYGLRGDIYVDMGDWNRAIDMFERGVSAADNTLTTPYLLRKLGAVYEQAGRYDDALAAYYRVVGEYRGSLSMQEAEKRIGALEQR